jgi:Icc-related predicted phosphoesterase
MASTAGIKTRICMISDTHTTSPYSSSRKDHAYRSPLPEADILLHSGDLTKVGYRTEHEETIAMFKAAPAELKLVIAGNHDITLDEEYFLRTGYRKHRRTEYFGTKDIPLHKDEQDRLEAIREGTIPPPAKLQAYIRDIKDLYTNESARAAGIRYLDEGIHTFTLRSGATFTVYASPYQPEFCNWAFAYDRNEDRFNLPAPGSEAPVPANPVPDFPSIDIMITHGPPAGVLDCVGDGRRTEHVGCEHLMRAAERARPRLYLFGHIHEGWGAVRGTYDSTKASEKDSKEGASASASIKLEEIPVDKKDMIEKRGVYLDVSSEAQRPLDFGNETLFVNASIVDIYYEPVNAPWVIDLDLPRV